MYPFCGLKVILVVILDCRMWLLLLGSLSSPGDGIVRIPLLTQVKKERKERQTSVRAVYLSFLSFFTCVSRVIFTVAIVVSPKHVHRYLFRLTFGHTKRYFIQIE